MGDKIVRLRGHHLVSLIQHQKNYGSRVDGVTETKHQESKVGDYTSEDIIFGKEFYTSLLSNPDQLVEIIMNTDDRCIACSNIDETKTKCDLYTPKNLRYEDRRSLKNSFPGLEFRRILTVKEILEYNKN